MVGALLLGFVCGALARIMVPRDAFRGMSGPVSWAVSLGLGLVGAASGRAASGQNRANGEAERYAGSEPDG